MENRRIIRIAQIAWVVSVPLILVLFIAGVVVYVGQLRQICTLPAERCGEYDYPTPVGAAQLAAAGLSLDQYALLRAGFRVIFALVPIGLGLLIFARRRDELFALFVSFFLISFGVAGEPLSVSGELHPAVRAVTTLIEYAAVLSLPLFFGLFPNGRMVPRLYWLVVVYFGAGYFLGDLFQWDALNDPVMGVVSYTMWLSVLVGGVAAQIYRYERVSTPEEKRQTRWVLFGLVLMAVFLVTILILTSLQGDDTIGTPLDSDIVRRVALLVLMNLAFELVYIFIGIAILRSRLFDIDVIIRRTITYTLVTAALALVFFGSVVVLQQLFASVTGSGQNELVTVLSTLAIAALFVPLRNWIQNGIDRRFYRKKYDAQKVLQEFGETVRDETDLEKLTERLLEVVQETMQPTSVGLWLKGANARAQRREDAKR